MCDTMVAAGGQSNDGAVLFGKNSDRERNEAQFLDALPAKTYRKGAKVKLTHVEIDQVPETHAVLLSKPFWIWGAEIGANEHGVVIGNEAVYGKRMPSPKPGVIGMDYLRLGLERGATAEEALDAIVVDYEPLPHVTDAGEAMQPGAPRVHETMQTQKDFYFRGEAKPVAHSACTRWPTPLSRAFSRATLTDCRSMSVASTG